MDKAKIISDDELNIIDGGTLYVKLGSGEQVEGQVKCIGGNVAVLYTEGGKEKYIDTGFDSQSIVGSGVRDVLKFFESQPIFNVALDDKQNR